MRREYARVDFSGADVAAPLREKWHGKLVGLYDGCAWSLGGIFDEGIGLTCPDECLRPLSEAEEEVARLLDETFWLRTTYTEDLASLRRLAAIASQGGRIYYGEDESWH